MHNRKEGGGMRILKRLAVWLLETLLAVFLIGLGWLLFVGYDKTRGFGRELLFSVTWIGLFSFSTGVTYSLRQPFGQYGEICGPGHIQLLRPRCS
jgi:hypothetical protein